MILVDLSQVMVASIMRDFRESGIIELDEDFFRHLVLNSLASYNRKFRHSHGDMVIAADNGRYWRKDAFPYYKANRAKSKEESEIDWKKLFESMNKIREEIKEFFPYRVINVPYCEGDDVIGVLCDHFGNTNEKILIVSKDHDFQQLHKFMNVEQWDPIGKKFIQTNDPERFLFEHILRGDKGDGVPNFLSQDDCLVRGIRQKSVMSKKVDQWVKLKPEEFCDETMLQRFNRNKKLVDLSEIPENLYQEILEEFEKEAGKDRKQIYGYFVKNKLRNLMADIQDY